MAKQRKTEGAAATRRQPRRAAKDGATSTNPPDEPTVTASVPNISKSRSGVKKAPRKRMGAPGKQLHTEVQDFETITWEAPKEEKGGSDKRNKKHINPPGSAAINAPKSQAGVQKASKKGAPGRPRKMLTTAQAIRRLNVKFEEDNNNEEKSKSKKKRTQKKYMEDDPILREEKEEGLQRSLRWLPVRGLRRAPSESPKGVPSQVWDSYSSLNAYMCAVSREEKQRTHAEEEEEEGEEGIGNQMQPLKRPTGVPEPLWHAYHSFDDWMFRKCLTAEEVLMLPLEKTVDKAWPGAPNGFKYIAEDVLVFDEPEKVEGTAFEYKLTNSHVDQLKSGRRVSMGRRPSQSPDIDLGTFFPHEDLEMNQVNSDLAGWI
ncbi:hypothetical protein PG993_000544 [Apiospora rasikravindrae]|uniref:Uncharacterized protein n=1 Tax=Apiospora rasikravindrae TaxID=990691 RepID=A0ABR1U8W4_9PEZI